MAFARIGSKFRVELTREEPRMIWQFDGFNQTLAACGYAADDQTGFFQLRNIIVVDLVAVAMAFADVFAAVDFCGKAARFEVNFLRTQTHGAAQVGRLITGFDAAVGSLPFVNQGNDRRGAFQVKLGRVRTFLACHVAGVFDQGNLHAQADAQVWYVVFTRIAYGGNFAFYAA